MHVPDLSTLEDENTEEVRKRAAYGAALWVPLVAERQTIGVFGVPGDEPIAFTERQIELVQSFADQAAIAIENSRLFNEVKAGPRSHRSARHQTAAAEVLKVIAVRRSIVASCPQADRRSALRGLRSPTTRSSFSRTVILKFMAQRGSRPRNLLNVLWNQAAQVDREVGAGRAGIDGKSVHVHD